MNIPFLAATVACLVLAAPSVRADNAGEPGGLHALTGVTLVTEPGAEPVSGTLVIRDGLIEVLGAGAEIPAGAVVHARPGRVVYAGFIEPYLRLPGEPATTSEPAPSSRTASAGAFTTNS